ncbi:hypothetical protein PFICI_00474 [Pestalotiopsis fici W106-1]|uniref:Serine aminopeptidase S33 domain-containing protein n=1 Tax=Pestalotiopsis fici (strain W106-1 / CGMCC3.15140) TaxID=1229662 RepID=W3XMY3_PESFW|nr:uncharacterized protein PFICI_00474 [Pestalotiopsis fici W106-1]ETS86646.1 hypothetical protein PFICI_00474 [Pestalotiopsis fici W106-1]
MEPATELCNGPTETSTITIVITTIVSTVTFLIFLKWSLEPRRPQILPGPLTTTIPRLTKEELAQVPYQPDHFPGARDVVTPYGNIRVYEFGPETGRKVLFLHGISTSCMTLNDIALDLASKGCRVMLYDLFGRGYSDGVGDLPSDTRLFVTQILLVLASSPLPWTGDGALNLVGYSLGGGIAVNFAAAFPRLVASLVLLAPAGLIRAANIGRASRLVFTSGLVPERLLEGLTRRRLRAPIGNAVAKRRRASSVSSVTNGGAVAAAAAATTLELPGASMDKEGYVDVAVQEVVDDDTPNSPSPIEAKIASYVRWMLDYHTGFVPSFMSTIRHGPLLEQHHYWRELAKREPGTTAVILGRQDELIQKADYKEDALPLMGGEGNVFWRVVSGGHNMPFTNSSEVIEAIHEFWGIKE